MRTYIKPVMESEAFVANEFVAACYTVKCTNCGVYKEGYDSLKNSVGSAEILGNTMTIWPDETGGCKHVEVPKSEPVVNEYPWTWVNIPSWLYWKIFVDILGWDSWTESTASYHPVSIENKWLYTTNHPNSSV